MIKGFDTKEGLPNARVHVGDKQATLHSIYPFKEAERIVSKMNPDFKWSLLAGVGLGYIAEAILNDSGTELILFEHSPEILDYAKSVRDMKWLLNHPRVHLFSDESKLITFLDDNHVKELNFNIHRPYLTLFNDIYMNLEGLIIAALSKQQINEATLNRFQKVWLRNVIKNSAYYFSYPGINTLKGYFKNKPAIVVGAGPSLKNNIDILNQHQNQVVIISTDTAYPMLLSRNIKPDFVVSGDPQNKNALYLLYARNSDTSLVIDSTASFLALSKFKPDNTFLYDSLLPLYKDISHFWGEKGRLRSGGSVSTSAFDLARYLDCSPIVFIGQDLAFSGKHTHFDGNILEEFLYYRINRFSTYERYNAGQLLFSDRIMIKATNGGKVPTDRKFSTFLNWFTKEIAQTDVPVINASQGGAFIDGANHQNLADALSIYSDTPIDKHIAFDYSTSSSASFITYLNQILRFSENLLPKAIKAKVASKNALRAYSLRKDPSSYFGAMSEFDKSFLSSVKQNPSISRFVEFTMQETINRIIQASEQKDISLSVIEEWVQLYHGALSGIRLIIRLLTKRLTLEKNLSNDV